MEDLFKTTIFRKLDNKFLIIRNIAPKSVCDLIQLPLLKHSVLIYTSGMKSLISSCKV